MIIKRKPGIKILMIALGALLIVLPFAGCAAEAPEPASKAPIVFADVGWDSVQVHNRIAAFIVENGYGYPESEFIPGETIPLFEGVARGDIDVEMECWMANQREAYDKHIADGTVVDLGSNFPDSWQGWLVPTYMIENGDLPEGVSVDDMAQYWELFKDPEDPTKGRYYSGPAGWEAQKVDEKKFEAYGLDEYYNIFLPGSNAALVASMAAAYAKGEPWLGYHWEPSWPLGKFDMTRIEEPPFDQEVWDQTRACGWPPTEVNIVVNSSFLDRAPGVVEFLEKYETTTGINNKVLAYMQANKASTGEAAIYFLQEYESLWTSWVPTDVASKVKAALP
ncbi:MAG: ABC transporter substrate-binding protein [Chloroflexota bacterium]|nr:ABC transporter substrate-binding protein [Chloroflexota bacterium]